MSKVHISLIVWLFLTCGAALGDDWVGILTKTGVLMLSQEPGNYFSIEVQVRPSDMAKDGVFRVGKNQLQVVSASVSEFLENPSNLSDARAILERHSEYEKAYLEQNVVHEPLTLTSHYENGTLFWTAKGSDIEFHVCTTLHNQSVIILTASILDPDSAETVLAKQSNSWRTLKFRDTPWSISELKALSERYRSGP